MKKYTHLFLFLFVTLFTSCEDNSGDYIEQMCTNAEMNSAIKSCLNVSKDTAINRLCRPNGFTDNELHRISLPAALQPVQDTLTAHGKGYLVDTLIVRINQSCESMGNDLTAVFTSNIGSITVADPASLITGNNHAITNYHYINYNNSLATAISANFTTKLNTMGAMSCLNEMMIEYHNYTTNTVSTDLPTYVINSCLTAIYQEMMKEEELIRTDKQHRVTDILQKVFGKLVE